MEHASCFGFVDAFAVDDMVEELPLFHELHDEEQLFGGFDDLVELDDVGVPDQFQDVDLPRDPFHVGHLRNLALFEYFDGYALIGGLVECGLDLSEGALADGLAFILPTVPIT